MARSGASLESRLLVTRSARSEEGREGRSPGSSRGRDERERDGRRSSGDGRGARCGASRGARCGARRDAIEIDESTSSSRQRVFEFVFPSCCRLWSSRFSSGIGHLVGADMRISELASRADSGATRGLLPPASAPGGPRSDAHPADGRRASHLRVVLETLAKGEEHTRASTRARADRPSSARRVVPRPPRRRPVPFLLREDGAGGPTPQAAVPDGPGRPTGGTAGPIEDDHRHHHGCVSRAPRRPRPRARGGVPRFRAPRPARPRNKQP